MTAVVNWRGPGAIVKRFRAPLPEPPRYRHLSRSVRPPTDGTGRALEEWLRDLAITTTIEAD